MIVARFLGGGCASQANEIKRTTMRTIRWFVGLVSTNALTAALVFGCGTSGPAPAGVDSAVVPSPDGSVEAASEAGAESSPPCPLDGGLLYALEASIGDSDATAPGCSSCIVQTCPTQLVSCSADCTCEEQLLAFVACVADAGSPFACAVPLARTSDPAAGALAGCVGGGLAGGTGPGCLAQCGVDLGGVFDGAIESEAESGAAETGVAETGVVDASAGD
jgi:hypothetical protein